MGSYHGNSGYYEAPCTVIIKYNFALISLVYTLIEIDDHQVVYYFMKHVIAMVLTTSAIGMAIVGKFN
jgi:hypothetical protein